MVVIQGWIQNRTTSCVAYLLYLCFLYPSIYPLLHLYTSVSIFPSLPPSFLSSHFHLTLYSISRGDGRWSLHYVEEDSMIVCACVCVWDDWEPIEYMQCFISCQWHSWLLSLGHDLPCFSQLLTAKLFPAPLCLLSIHLYFSFSLCLSYFGAVIALSWKAFLGHACYAILLNSKKWIRLNFMYVFILKGIQVSGTF